MWPSLATTALGFALEIMPLGSLSGVNSTVWPQDQHRTSTFVRPRENKRASECSDTRASILSLVSRSSLLLCLGVAQASGECSSLHGPASRPERPCGGSVYLVEVCGAIAHLDT